MNQLNIAFFTEAGKTKGMGHLVRCYTIATVFKKYHHKIEFYLDSDIDFSYKYDDILEFEWETLKITNQYNIIFIDSYIATLDIYSILDNQTSLLICLDDYNRLIYPKNSIVINFAPESKNYFDTTSKNKYLLGVQYLPIREEFMMVKQNDKKHILIMLGGSDTQNLTQTIVDILDSIDISKVVVVNNITTKNQLKKYNNLTILYKPEDKILIDNISQSICAVTTASMSVYEIASIDIPSIIVAVSKNQEIGINQLLKYNIAKYKIDIKDTNWKTDILKYIQKLKQLKKFHSNIDTNGTQRIYNKIIGQIK